MIRKIIVGACLLLLSCTLNVGAGAPTPTKVENVMQQIRPSDSQAFRVAVKEEIFRLGIQHPEIVFMQFREESGNGGSSLARTQNNLFGMKYPGKRKTTAIRKGSGGYSVYKTWQDAVKDYKLYQDAYMKNLSRSQYLNKLRRSYSKNPNYLKNFLK